MSKDWLWGSVHRSQHGMAHKHIGSLHAPDAEQPSTMRATSTRARATKA